MTRRARTPIPDVLGMGADDTLDHAQLVALLAEHGGRSMAIDERTRRKNARGEVDYALRRPDNPLPPPVAGKWRLADIASSFPKLMLNGVIRYPASGGGALVMPLQTLASTGYQLPSSVAEAEEMIGALRRELRASERALDETRSLTKKRGSNGK